MSYDPNSNVMLDEDLTGTNPDNLIENEPHVLSNKSIRSISPKLGPFFGEGVVIMDGGVALQRGVDYQLVELHQETTLLTGREIYSVILIISPHVSTEVTVTYQALGGLYSLTGSNTVIANLYESIRNDNRPVDWKQVFNKPSEFNPTNHRHLLEDLYGFEPVVDYLERIKRTIGIGQINILIEAFRALMGKFPCGELPLVLPSSRFIQYDAMLYFLSKKKILSQLTIDTDKCVWTRGRNIEFFIDTTTIPVGQTVYWEFYKEGGGTVTTIGNSSGTVISNGEVIRVRIYLPTDRSNSEPKLYLGAKLDPNQEDYDAVSYIIDLMDPPVSDSAIGYMLERPDDLNIVTSHPYEYQDDPERRLWYLLKCY